MAVYPQQNNNFSKSPAPLDYDLESEKQRIAEATEEIKKELWEKWQKRYADAEIFPKTISALNPGLVDFLLSFQHTFFYNDLAKKLSLSQQQRDILPQIIWKICLNKSWDNLDSLLQTNLKINSGTSSQIASLLDQNILIKAKELVSARPEAKNVITPIIGNKASMTVSDALKAYPEVGEQLITSEKIVLKNFPDPVRPCLKNWLADFTFTLGRDKHTAMDRGIYLFQSTNGKKLNSQDRNKLAYILKAFDEGLPVSINKDTKQIIFSSQSTVDSSQDDKKQETRNNNQTNSNIQNIKPQGFSSDMHNAVRFSSAQKLPYERIDTPYIIKPVTPVRPVVPKQEENRPIQKNVVNLKELQ